MATRIADETVRLLLPWPRPLTHGRKPSIRILSTALQLQALRVSEICCHTDKAARWQREARGNAMRHTSRRGRSGLGNVLVSVALAAGLTCGGCSKPAADPAPTKSPEVTTSMPSPVSWESEFSAEQLEAYRQALATVSAYQAAVKPIWATGKATPAAKRLFMEYFIPWQFYYDQLVQYEEAGIRLEVKDAVLDSRASRVELGADGASVSIRQCIDQTESSGTQNGKALPTSFDTPQLVDFVVSQADGRWLISTVSDPAEDRPCDR